MTSRLRGLRMLTMAFGLVALVACGSGADAPTAASSAEGSGGPAANEVVLRLIAFQPEQLEVSAGTAVTWKQQDDAVHTVTSGTVEVDATGTIKTDSDGAFKKELKKGEEFSFTFEKAGTYSYFCEIHPATMQGQIVVQ